MPDLPVPRIWDWSSKASETAVEAEYVLMEKGSGRPLAELWEDMQADEQLALVEQIVRIPIQTGIVPLSLVLKHLLRR